MLREGTAPPGCLIPLSRNGSQTAYLAGCSKSPSSKAAGESKPEAYPLGYVEDFDKLRTKLAGFFSSLPACVSTRRQAGS
jgi:hypothetical protein